MEKMQYESPELDIRWFEIEDVISYSDPAMGGFGGGDGVADGDW